MTLQKYFLYPSKTLFTFCQPHQIELKLGLQISGRPLTANHLDQLLSVRNREQQSDHIKYTLLLQLLGFVVPFTSLSETIILGQNHFAEPNQYVLAFFIQLLT
jgi:hypothetical protein